MKRNHLNDFLVEQIKNKDSQIEGLNQLFPALSKKSNHWKRISVRMKIL